MLLVITVKCSVKVWYLWTSLCCAQVAGSTNYTELDFLLKVMPLEDNFSNFKELKDMPEIGLIYHSGTCFYV